MRTNQADKMLGVDRVVRKPRFRINITPDGMIGLANAILLAVLLLYVVGTAVSFGPKAAEYRTWYQSMQSEIDQLAAEQSELAAEVEAWPGVTEIPAETIPALADPAETTMLVPAISIENPQSEWMNFYVTAYCPCEKCCGKWSGYPLPNGLYPEEGRTVAADLSFLPRGTVVEIEGYGIRTVEDCGGAIQGRELDLFFEDHDSAGEFGARNLRVRIIEEVAP